MNKDDKLLELNEESDIFYITNLISIFPHDVELTDKGYKAMERKRLRPEFMKQYSH